MTRLADILWECASKRLPRLDTERALTSYIGAFTLRVAKPSGQWVHEMAQRVGVSQHRFIGLLIRNQIKWDQVMSDEPDLPPFGIPLRELLKQAAESDLPPFDKDATKPLTLTIRPTPREAHWLQYRSAALNMNPTGLIGLLIAYHMQEESAEGEDGSREEE